jgi:hypothetical protein
MVGISELRCFSEFVGLIERALRFDSAFAGRTGCPRICVNYRFPLLPSYVSRISAWPRMLFLCRAHNNKSLFGTLLSSSSASLLTFSVEGSSSSCRQSATVQDTGI